MAHIRIESPRSCPLCGGHIFCVELYSPLSIGKNEQPYVLYECKLCAVQFWWPMQNPGPDWYRQDGRYASRNSDPSTTPVVTHRAFLKDHPNVGGSLLDVGCGTGNFLLAAKKKDYLIRGIDFDPDAVNVARDIFGLNQVSTASLGDLIREGANFDVITFFEVLEHMDLPNIFIEEIKTLLRPGGYIGLSVPYRKSWDVFKDGDKPPRHLTRWDKQSMKNFLTHHGFEVIRIRPFWINIDFIITKFHFWSEGILSFGLVNKVRNFPILKINNQSVKKTRNNGILIRMLKISAKIKDYFLFLIPSLFLYIYLIIIGKQYLGMYVLARKSGK